MSASNPQTAHHEAGHAVVAILVGLPFTEVTVTASLAALGQPNQIGHFVSESPRSGREASKRANFRAQEFPHLMRRCDVECVAVVSAGGSPPG